MGNGASSIVVNDFCSINNFKKIEKLSRSGYFQEDFEKYKAVVTQAIKLDAIDLIEVLVTAGNLKMMRPLHLACSLGKLESVELLCSAGQSTYLKDDLGRTPLHLCSLMLSNEGALCATFMILRGGKALSMFDRDGLTPLHSAAVANNVRVLRVLLNYCTDVTMPSRSGKTALFLAQEAGCSESVKLLQDCSTSNTKRGKSGSSSKSSPVNQQRVMQIWEKFFENAFKSSGCDWTDDNEVIECEPYTTYRRDGSKRDDLWCSDSKRDAKQERISDNDITCKDWSVSTSNLTSFEATPQLRISSIRSWYDWVVCFDLSDNGGGYYALHQHTGETRWIEEHMQRISESLRAMDDSVVRLKWSSSADYGSAEWNGRSRSSVAIATSHRMMLKPLPSSLHEAVVDGWCTYYDQAQNACWWWSAPTLCVEAFLPLALTETVEDLSALSMRVSADGTEWVECDQRCAMAWILVIVTDPCGDQLLTLYDKSADEDIDNDYHSQKSQLRVAWNDVSNEKDEEQDVSCRSSSSGSLQYYLNRITGETSWVAPINWATVTAQWNGGYESDVTEWILCCSEDALDDIFW